MAVRRRRQHVLPARVEELRERIGEPARELDVAQRLLDVRRLSDALVRIRGKIDHQALDKISPFAVPVMLEIGKEPVSGASVQDAILREAEADLVREAMG